ncbi:hypothetical protein MHBO_000287 [Bonamia ostreae]|uniref:Uncharacterized protein n=1 Tax=Bonamia ostreae TaxID=126728 RepID=A0ABV2AF32_9EUKA
MSPFRESSRNEIDQQPQSYSKSQNSDIELIFEELGIGKYLPMFLNEEMEPEDMLLLSPEEQIAFIPKMGPRMRLIDYLCRNSPNDPRVANYKQKRQSANPNRSQKFNAKKFLVGNEVEKCQNVKSQNFLKNTKIAKSEKDNLPNFESLLNPRDFNSRQHNNELISNSIRKDFVYRRNVGSKNQNENCSNPKSSFSFLGQNLLQIESNLIEDFDDLQAPATAISSSRLLDFGGSDILRNESSLGDNGIEESQKNANGQENSVLRNSDIVDEFELTNREKTKSDFGENPNLELKIYEAEYKKPEFGDEMEKKIVGIYYSQKNLVKQKFRAKALFYGKVCFYRKKERYGFGTLNPENDRIFIHNSALISDPTELEEGSEIVFNLCPRLGKVPSFKGNFVFEDEMDEFLEFLKSEREFEKRNMQKTISRLMAVNVRVVSENKNRKFK